MCSRVAHRRSGSYYNRKAAAVILRLPHILRNVVCMTCFARARARARARASIARNKTRPRNSRNWQRYDRLGEVPN